jgi:integrase
MAPFLWVKLTLANDAGFHKLSPHRLRHILATRLLNSRMGNPRIQRLLGHEQVNTTMIYARIQDQTVGNDNCRAMKQIESKLLHRSNSPASGHGLAQKVEFERANPLNP